MRLHSLRVEQWRQFRAPIELTQFAPGLNLFCGPNESGKSTLVRAIRAAFFERHRSSSVDDLQPWGDSAAAPKVALQFDWQGQRWSLHKTFLKSKRCDLRVDARSFSGDEAEEKLAELMGFQFPGRGASQPQHWGIPGLLWIEQGEGQNVRASVEHAGQHLQSALGLSLGEVASSAGDALIDAVSARRARLLTATGKPTGELAKGEERQAALLAELKALREKTDSYRAQVDRLGALRDQQAQDAAERPWEALRAQAQAAREQLAQVAQWTEEQRAAEQALKACRAQRVMVRGQLQAFESQAEGLAARAQAQAVAHRALEAQHAQQPAWLARLQAAQDGHAAARGQVQAAREAGHRAALQREQAQLRQAVQRAQAQWTQVQSRQAEADRLRLQAQACQIAPKALKELLRQQAALDDLRLRQQAVATRVDFDLLPGQSLRLDGEVITGQTRHLLLAEAELHIEGLGRVRIAPGGEDVRTLALEQQRAQDALAASLRALGVASAAEAQARAERYAAMHKEVELHDTALAALAPEGAAALQRVLVLDGQRLVEVDALLAALPASGAQPGLSLKAAEAQEQAAALAWQQAQADAHAARQALALAERDAQAAASELARLQAEMQAPERAQREQQARAQWTELRAEEEHLLARSAAIQARIDAAQPDILRQDVARFDSSAAQLEDAATRRQLEVAALQGHIEAAGAQGLEEALAGAEQRSEANARRLDELRRQAGALDLLQNLLRKQRQALTRQLQAPLQKHLDRYLQLLFPQARLAVDEALRPGQLTRKRANVEEVGDFDALSFGAREQMGLIARLAYADLLQAAGRPTLIILDDALVHSDAQRLAQMKRVLFDASQRHQILLFTCHPEHWRDLGVAAREIEALKAAA